MEEFQTPSTLGDYAALSRFHIELTARIYEVFSKASVPPIGGGVDVITVSPGDNVTYDYSQD